MYVVAQEEQSYREFVGLPGLEVQEATAPYHKPPALPRLEEDLATLEAPPRRPRGCCEVAGEGGLQGLPCDGGGDGAARKALAEAVCCNLVLEQLHGVLVARGVCGLSWEAECKTCGKPDTWVINGTPPAPADLCACTKVVDWELSKYSCDYALWNPTWKDVLYNLNNNKKCFKR